MKIAAIGAGAWGKNVIRNLEDLGVLSGIVESTNARLDAYALGHPNLSRLADWRAALDSDCDAGTIATLTATHHEIALAALRAGKDVFVEKPMTHSAADARSLVEAAEAADCVLMVGHLLLYPPAIAWMRDYVAIAKLGELFRYAR